MLKFLNLILMTLIISTNIKASESINNIIINDIDQINANNTETYFDLPELIQNAKFTIKNNINYGEFFDGNNINNEVIATIYDRPNQNINNNTFNTTNRTIIKPQYKSNSQYNIVNNINGNFDNQNEQIFNTTTANEYDKAFFLINRQKYLSTLNYKNNTNKELTNVEKDISNSLENVKYKKLGYNKRLQWVVPMSNNNNDLLDYNNLHKYNTDLKQMPTNFYLDIKEILENNKVNNETEQLKLDVFRQLEQLKKNNNKNNKLDDSFKIMYNYFIDKFSKEHHTRTYFKLRDLMQKADFSFKDNKIIATFSENPDKIVDYSNYKTSEKVEYQTHINNIEGKISNKEEDNKIKNKDGIANKYDKANLLISNQETLSVLNRKLNNNLPMNEAEQAIFKHYYDVKYNKFKDTKINNGVINTTNRRLDSIIHFSQNNYNLLKRYDADPYEIPYSFYYDVNEILKKNKVENSQEQLKLDIYRQIEDAKKQKYKYDDSFKIAYKYFINQFYDKWAYANTVDGRTKEVIFA